MPISARLISLFVVLAMAPAAAAAATKPGKASKPPKPPKNAPVVLYHVNHKETLSLRLRDAQGKPVKGIQKRFDKFLRCHHTNARHAMNPRLMRLLYQTGRHWPGKKVEVVSGYRNPTVAKNPRSPHMKGWRATSASKGSRRPSFVTTCARLRQGRRRYYPNSTFVHLDVRKDKSAFWIDYSGPASAPSTPRTRART
jgi:uncharacterized protein YcbK (DUF882 family)